MLADVDVRQVGRSQDRVLANLFNFYMHDMAEWFLFESGEDGRYSYATDDLWDAGVEVFLAYHGVIPVGFGLVASGAAYSAEPDVRDLKEFFVIRRHRRSGLGGVLAAHLWDARPGPWVVRVYQRNAPALPFWRRTIASYSGGEYRENALDIDGLPWSHFSFDTAARSLADR